MRSISLPGRCTSTLRSLPISLVTLSRMRSGFYTAPEPRNISPWRMRRTFLFSLILLTLAAVQPAGAASRISFERIIPAQYDVAPAEDIAVVDVPKNEPEVEVFVENLLGEVNYSRILRAHDGRKGPVPAQAFLLVESFSCELAVREGEGSSRDAHGNRVKRRHEWIDATCTANIVVQSREKKPLFSFSARGEGTSPRVLAVTADERQIAARTAARYTAVNAAERITPRRVRESIALDEGAPAFAEGMAMIQTDRFSEARAVWERALNGHPQSAALHFNLAAVCEALGDRRAAQAHYNAAQQIAPAEERYSHEFRLFERRAERQ